MAKMREQRFGKPTAPALFAGVLFCLIAGIFFGNLFIAIGHVLLIVALVWQVKTGGWDRAAIGRLSPSAWWLAAFVVVCAVSVLANLPLIDGPVDHLKKLRYPALVLAALCVPALFAGIESKVKLRNLLVLAWLVPLVVAAVLGGIGYLRGAPVFGGEVADIERVSGVYGQVMTFAYALQFSVVALAIFFTMPRLWRRVTSLPWWIVLLALPVAGGTLYLTYTRGAMLGVVVGLVVYAMLKSRWMVVAVAVIGLVGGTIAFKEQSRYFKFKSSVRTVQWQAACLAFAERPVFGYGFRNFEEHSVEIKTRFGFTEDKHRRVDGKREAYIFKGHAHNNFLEAFASTGVFGGLAFLGFCFCWLRESWRSDHAAIFVPLIAAFLVSGFFENTFFDSEVLNCILLIYFFSQIVFDAEVVGDKENVDQPSAGVTTTET